MGATDLSDRRSCDVPRRSMDPPPVRYAKNGEVHIAYQVWGNGPLDLILVPGWISHLGVMWENPALVEVFQELATFARVVMFDKRGVGLSDRVTETPTLEDRLDDTLAVMEAAGSRKAVLVGFYEGVPMSVLFGAIHPERTLGLVLIGGMLKGIRSREYPWAYSRKQYLELNERIRSGWGTPEFVDWLTKVFAPSRGADARWKRLWARELSYGASPAAAIALNDMNKAIDVRSAVSSLHAPTLVLHVAGPGQRPFEHGRHIAASIRDAEFQEVPGRDFLFYVNPSASEVVLRSIRRFVAKLPPPADEGRMLATILFTDMVRSTEKLSRLGDNAWGQLQARYFEGAGEQLSRFRGREIKRLGDGLLAINFDGPTRAVRCALALRTHASHLGLPIRIGLHTGECLLRSADVEGIAVNTAARVCAAAGTGEILVTETVRDLSAGSGLRFLPRGTHRLRGIRGSWPLFAVGQN